MKQHVGIKVGPDGRRVAILVERGPAPRPETDPDKVRPEVGGWRVA